MKKLFAVLSLALLTTSINAALDAKPARRAVGGFDTRYAVTAQGNTMVGNPRAPIKLVEFISYTCPHCAQYNADSMAKLRGQQVRQGKVSVELRPVVRTGIKVDLVAALLALCGPASKHFGNNDAILASQANWLNRLTDPALQQRWDALPPGAYNGAVAKELGLYVVMQQRGYSAAQIDRCLADKAKADHITRVTDDAFNHLGVQGTPSFMVNGSLLSVYDWGNLDALIESMLGE